MEDRCLISSETYKSHTDSTSFSLFKNAKPLESQVAGHSFNERCFTIGMLKDDQGYILKPVNKVGHGKREISFYESVMNSTEKDLSELKKFIPQYFGCQTLSINGRDVQFLKLADATKGFLRACVMDVKIGKQTWEPGAPIEKQKSEEGKYVNCKKQCGFCIPGYQVYNIASGNMEKYGKDYGKTLCRNNIPEVLKRFLNWGQPKSKIISDEILQQLISILEWWRHQRTFHIYSSSVLLTYDAEFIRNEERYSNPDQSKSQLTSYSRVCLIDFAHVVPAKICLDYNYLSGLECFVDIFSSLIKSL